MTERKPLDDMTKCTRYGLERMLFKVTFRRYFVQQMCRWLLLFDYERESPDYLQIFRKTDNIKIDYKKKTRVRRIM